MKLFLRWLFLMPIEFAAALGHGCQTPPLRRHRGAMSRFVGLTKNAKRSSRDRRFLSTRGTGIARHLDRSNPSFPHRDGAAALLQNATHCPAWSRILVGQITSCGGRSCSMSSPSSRSSSCSPSACCMCMAVSN